MVNDTGEMAAEDPYRADAEWMAEFYDKSVEVGGDPVVVAEAIVKAAIDPSTPLHNLIGDDAHMFVDLVAQSGTVEAGCPSASRMSSPSPDPGRRRRPPADSTTFGEYRRARPDHRATQGTVCSVAQAQGEKAAWSPRQATTSNWSMLQQSIRLAQARSSK